MSAARNRTRPARLAARWAGISIALCAGAVAAAESDIRGPDITIIAEEEKTIFEYRQGGQLRMVRVVPKWGKPYYLVPADNTRGDGDLERADKLVPSWVLFEF
jgi:hypothetical protein